MTDARAEVLARIRAATGGGGSAGEVNAAYAALPRDYLRAHHDLAGTDVVALFAERAADYRAIVERVARGGLPAAIASAVAAIPVPDGVPRTAAAARILVPGGVPDGWLTALTAGTELVRDEPQLTAAELDRVSGVITGCAVAIAETGTVILDHGPGQGRRAVSLVPDFHLVVVRSGQIAADLPDAMARLDPARPQTLVSGPSATSDIELIRVEGVHGPRTLHILIAD